jgi:hypothetical protein
MQLSLLKLNAGIGRALEHEALLQRANAALSIENSELSSSGHILSLASRLGMAPVAAGAVHFLQARPELDVRLSAAALSGPAGVPATASAETSTEDSEGTQASSGEQPATEAGTTAPSGESSSAASTASAAPAEASTGESAGTQGSGESSGSTSSEPAAPPGEAAQAPSGAAEGTPAGGTQAGSSG